MEKWHQTKVHHNRWFLWTISIIIIVGVALIGYLKYSDIQSDLDLIQTAQFPDNSRFYINPDLGFSLRYPLTWHAESELGLTISFLPEGRVHEGFSVSVVPVTSEKSLRGSLDIVREDPVRIGTVNGTRITNKLGQTNETVVLVKNNKKLYILRGNADVFDRILKTFRFI